MKTHGMSKKSPAYKSWLTMRKRCYNERCPDYPLYGARGIKVCERWNRFENFYADMGERPDGMTLDRLDSNGDYAPDNCRWATTIEQARNKRNVKMVTFKGQTKSVRDFCDDLNLNVHTVLTRLQMNWPVERALTTPTGRFSNVCI